MKLKPGDKAPDFTVRDENGTDLTLSSLRGKKVVLFFYPKDMTPGCTAEACNLRDNYKVLQKEGFEILGVSTDDERSHQKFIAKEKLPFRLLADTDKSLHQKYGTWIEKSMYGRRYMGTARTTFIINEDGIVEEIINKVDTKNHTDQILKKTSPSATTHKAAKVAKKSVKKSTALKKSVKKTASKKKK